jgi:hypothetical protein
MRPLRRPPLEPLAGSSMRGNQVRTRLSDYLDAEAGVEVEQHLRGCGSCLELANGLQGTVELCREYEPSVKPQPLTHWPGLSSSGRGKRLSLIGKSPSLPSKSRACHGWRWLASVGLNGPV